MTCVRILILALAATPALAAAPDLPKRQSGLWEHAMQMDTMPGYTHRVLVCVGDQLDDLATPENATACSKMSIRREGDRVLIDAVCMAGGSAVTSQGSFAGDFSQRYAGRMRTTFAPPLHGMANSEMRMEAHRLGPCKPGQKPGDTEMQGLPGGININEMMKNMPKMPGR